MDIVKYAKFVKVEVDPQAFPVEVKHEGVTYFRTGKVGTTRGGVPTAEYSTTDDARVWRDADGEVRPD